MQKQQTDALLWLIGITGILSQFTLTFCTPIFPEIGQYLSLQKSQLQNLITYYLLGYALFQFLAGGLSDKAGRRLIFIIGHIIALTGTLLIFIPNIYWIYISRFLQGAGFGIIGVITKSALRDRYSGKEYATKLSYVLSFIFITPLSSPLIVSFISYSISWKANFIFISLLTICSLFASLLFFPQTQSLQKRQHEKFKTFITILHKNPQFWFFAFLSAMIYSIDLACELIGIFILRNDYNLSLAQTSIALTFPLIGLIVGTSLVRYINISLIDIQKYALIWIIFICLLGLLAITFLQISVFIFLALIFLILIPCGVFYTTLTALALEPFEYGSGFASSLFGTLHFLIAAVMSFIISYLLTGPFQLFSLIFSLSLISLILLLLQQLFKVDSNASLS